MRIMADQCSAVEKFIEEYVSKFPYVYTYPDGFEVAAFNRKEGGKVYLVVHRSQVLAKVHILETGYEVKCPPYEGSWVQHLNDRGTALKAYDKLQKTGEKLPPTPGLTLRTVKAGRRLKKRRATRRAKKRTRRSRS
jgi:hypothetical protein